MNKASILVVLYLIFGLCAPVGALEKEEASNLGFCVNNELGVRYKCDPDWQMQTVDDAILIVISSEPDVALIIAKIDSRVKFLSQLTRSFLDEKNRYEQGFRTERTKFGEIEAIKVKAFAKNNPEKRLLDYYFMNDSQLYAILFSTYPKEATDEYKFLFKEIVDHFKFL